MAFVSRIQGLWPVWMLICAIRCESPALILLQALWPFVHLSELLNQESENRLKENDDLKNDSCAIKVARARNG